MQFMNTQKMTETRVIPVLIIIPIEAVMNTKHVSAKIMECPAIIFAKRRIINAIGLVKIPINSTKGIIGIGSFK